MDAMKAILTRRVARSFAERPVELDSLKQIVDAGRHAMSARNLQPWLFLIIRNRDTLRQLGALCSSGRFLSDAPSAIAVLKDLGNKRWADIDCAQAVQNMAVAGWSMGLATCWVGNFDVDAISRLFNMPVSHGIFTILPFGYPKEAARLELGAFKPRSETVFLERYGEPLKD